MKILRSRAVSVHRDMLSVHRDTFFNLFFILELLVSTETRVSTETQLLASSEQTDQPANSVAQSRIRPIRATITKTDDNTRHGRCTSRNARSFSSSRRQVSTETRPRNSRPQMVDSIAEYNYIHNTVKQFIVNITK